jgi:hypothetical protein
MASMILIAILGALAILCLVLVIWLILGMTRQTSTTTASQVDAFTQSLTTFQAAQTDQLGQVLDRHSADLRSLLQSQTDYINRFLNGPIQQADSPLANQPEQTDLPDPDPANWSLEEQLAAMPASMRATIEREQMENLVNDRLSAPSHPIRYHEGVPLVDPSLSSAEARATNWVTPTMESDRSSLNGEG